MNKAPTYKQISRIVRLLGGSGVKCIDGGWKTAGQREGAKVLAENDQVIYQAYRRSGKTFIVAVIAAIYIIEGRGVIVGSPTLSQSSRILYAEIVDMVDTLFELLGGVKKIRDSLTYTTWSNGGMILALTANIKSNQQEGYGAALLLIDEAHRIDPDILPILLPMIDDAVEDSIGKCILLGIGGHRTSLIELQKEKKGWTKYKYPASEEPDPSKQVIFDKAKDNHSDIWYNQHYECMPCQEGQRLCFPSIPVRIDISKNIGLGIRAINYFGIDVGKVDETVVVVGEKVGEIVNVIDHFSMTGTDHIPIAKAVYHFINTNYTWSDERIAVEYNAVGGYFLDTLHSLGMYAGSITSTETFKDGAWHKANKMMEKERLGIDDQKMYIELSNMSYSIKKNGHMDFDHNDYFSAFTMLMGICK
jgi:hypothetical protein